MIRKKCTQCNKASAKPTETVIEFSPDLKQFLYASRYSVYTLLNENEKVS